MSRLDATLGALSLLGMPEPPILSLVGGHRSFPPVIHRPGPFAYIRNLDYPKGKRTQRRKTHKRPKRHGASFKGHHQHREYLKREKKRRMKRNGGQS